MGRDVESTLKFVPADTQVRTMSGSADLFNNTTDIRPITIHDARGLKDQPSLSKKRFQYITHKSDHVPIIDPSKIKTEFYAETADLLMNILDPPPTYVEVASNILRTTTTDVDSEYTGTPGPARPTHVDQTPKAEDAKRLSQTRWAIMNVWRPLKTIKKAPLAVCDGSTLSPGDLLPIQMDYSRNARAKALGEIAAVKYNSKQRWYYLSDMDVDEALIMKIYDSGIVGGLDEGRVVPHASFEDPSTKDEILRESVEFRCLVFWEDQPLHGLRS
ncbi:hypothetical protein BDW69DRAFT_196109 [Aspergillus filifer]